MPITMTMVKFNYYYFYLLLANINFIVINYEMILFYDNYGNITDLLGISI